MAAQYEKDIITTSIVSANNLVGQEGNAVDFNGTLTANNTQVAKGVVRIGYANNLASELIIKGECMGRVTLGANAATAIGSKLSSSANGCFELANNTYVRAVALEVCNNANNTSLIRICLL